MNTYISQLNDKQFGVLRDGRIIAVFESFKKAKLLQLKASMEEVSG